MARIVDDLFLLARADAGHLVLRRAPIYLEEVVDSSARSVRHIADQKGVTLSLNDLVEAPVDGDADLLGPPPAQPPRQRDQTFASRRYDPRHAVEAGQ
jgi:signal transduction histidine kinase